MTPALLTLAFSGVFLLPKLKTIWRDAGYDSPGALRMLQLAGFLGDHAAALSAALLVLLVLLEWRARRWPRYRRAAVGTAAFLVNTGVLLFMTVMFATALLAAPALVPIR